ncbi:MAG: HAD family hydrolase [Thermoplasmata archaeon]
MTIDIDGTLTRVHGWRVIADALGQREAFERSNRRFFANEVGEDEHLDGLLNIAAGHPLAEVERALLATPKMDGIGEGVTSLHESGCRVALLTHNPRYVCEWYCRSFGFDDFEGTTGQSVVDGVIGPAERVRADKAGGLRRLADRTGVLPASVVHIGDGRADALIFPVVGAGISLNSALPEVDRAADRVLRTHDFREVVATLEHLPPRT